MLAAPPEQSIRWTSLVLALAASSSYEGLRVVQTVVCHIAPLQRRYARLFRLRVAQLASSTDRLLVESGAHIAARDETG